MCLFAFVIEINLMQVFILLVAIKINKLFFCEIYFLFVFFWFMWTKVDEKYVRTHHVYSLNGKTHRRSQQQQEQELEVLQAKQKKEQMSKMPDSQPFYSQQQQQHNHIYQLPFHLPHLLTDRYDKSLRWSGNRPMGM